MASSGGKKFRNDIEGLRGLAIALVVIFHIFVGRVSSGVDVFLLLGGIFFFGSQLANARNPKGLTFIQSLIRMLRRLFPLLAVVTGTTLATGLFLMPRLQHLDLAKDSLAALGYFINWQLAFSGREYTSAGSTVSPFQHLWSMSAQLQIYVGSLIVVTLLALIFRRHSRKVLVVVLTTVTVLSFGYAAYLQGQDQSLNYYSSLSRFWEIGLGGLLGMLIMPRSDHGEKPPRAYIPTPTTWLRRIFGVVGVAMIVSTGYLVDGASTFPGPLTLFPLTGAVLVILAGQGGTPVGMTRLLESRFMQFLGRISYALYLWHWPMLILVVAYKGWEPTEMPIVGVGIIAASLLLAWLSNRFIERPLRQGKRPARAHVLWSPKYWWNSVKVWPKTVYSLVILLIAGGVIVTGPLVEKNQTEEGEQLWQLESDALKYPGPLNFSDGIPAPEFMPITPPYEDMIPLLPPTQPDGCQIGFEDDVLVLNKDYNRSDEECAYGDINSNQTVYVIGGSHSEQFMPALDLVGKRRGVKIMPILKMGCPVNANIPMWDGSDFPSCREWSKKVVKHVLDNPPTDGIWMTGTRPSDIAGSGPEQVPPEYVDLVKQFTDAGIHSYLMRDNAWHMTNPEKEKYAPLNMRECVGEMAEGTRTATEQGKRFPGLVDKWRPTHEEIEAINAECGSWIQDSLLPVDPQLEAYAGLDVTLLDITPGICDANGWCPAIIGNLLAYRDAHHFTNVFASRFANTIDHQMYVERRAPMSPQEAEKAREEREKAIDLGEREATEGAHGARDDGARGEGARGEGARGDREDRPGGAPAPRSGDEPDITDPGARPGRPGGGRFGTPGDRSLPSAPEPDFPSYMNDEAPPNPAPAPANAGVAPPY